MKVRRVWFQGHPVFEHPEVSQQPASLSHVGPSLSTSAGHAGGNLSASIVHAEDNPSTTVSHVDTVENTTRSKHKPKFPCKLCEGDHLTYKCPSIAEVRRVWFNGHPVFEHSEAFQQPTSLSQVTQPLVIMLGEKYQPM